MERVTASRPVGDVDNNTKTIVTFVMPAYNAGKYIAQAIESIQEQTISKGWSLLVCDDGSTDDTLEIVKKYAAKDPRVKWIRMPKNSGCVYQPRKAAIVAAKSEYVAPLDADDGSNLIIWKNSCRSCGVIRWMQFIQQCIREVTAVFFYNMMHLCATRILTGKTVSSLHLTAGGYIVTEA